MGHAWEAREILSVVHVWHVILARVGRGYNWYMAVDLKLALSCKSSSTSKWCHLYCMLVLCRLYNTHVRVHRCNHRQYSTIFGAIMGEVCTSVLFHLYWESVYIRGSVSITIRVVAIVLIGVYYNSGVLPCWAAILYSLGQDFRTDWTIQRPSLWLHTSRCDLQTIPKTVLTHAWTQQTFIQF